MNAAPFEVVAITALAAVWFATAAGAAAARARTGSVPHRPGRLRGAPEVSPPVVVRVPAPAPPAPAAAAPRAPQPRIARADGPASARVAAFSPAALFAPGALARAVIAAEVLAPPLALRD